MILQTKNFHFQQFAANHRWQYPTNERNTRSTLPMATSPHPSSRLLPKSTPHCLQGECRPRAVSRRSTRWKKGARSWTSLSKVCRRICLSRRQGWIQLWSWEGRICKRMWGYIGKLNQQIGMWVARCIAKFLVWRTRLLNCKVKAWLQLKDYRWRMINWPMIKCNCKKTRCHY